MHEHTADSADTIRIDLDSAVPLYRQIGDAIRALLVAGNLAPGDVLPPVRRLAIDLGLHFNTVAEAYRSLALEGWLDLRRGRGALVLARAVPPAPADDVELKFAQRLQEHVAATRAEGLAPAAIARHLRRLAAGLDPCPSAAS
jgi:GntR family transcriptional regulator